MTTFKLITNMREKFEELIEGYITGNIGISAHFLNKPLAAALHHNLVNLNNNRHLEKAGIGNAIKDNFQKIRSDKTSWLSEDSDNSAEREFLDTMAQFMGYLNETCYTGLNAFEFHYALYEPGTFYGRHRDRLRNDDARKFSIISYLNENWLTAEGGQLIVYNDDGAPTTILPENLKSVFFKSDLMEHEVTIATRQRLSVTGWLKRI
ncbi:MAG: 2OG-Fe(II) oxygenase [Taibaiella sp.]|nr:2OG-Fe(II) oxygenase [Taibaiella sp.]